MKFESACYFLSHVQVNWLLHFKQLFQYVNVFTNFSKVQINTCRIGKSKGGLTTNVKLHFLVVHMEHAQNGHFLCIDSEHTHEMHKGTDAEYSHSMVDNIHANQGSQLCTDAEYSHSMVNNIHANQGSQIVLYQRTLWCCSM